LLSENWCAAGFLPWFPGSGDAVGKIFTFYSDLGEGTRWGIWAYTPRGSLPCWVREQCIRLLTLP
jgi:hypothetical protein